ncbi:unnamed protein product, partial [Symbiodinium sp. CCMP2456]
FHGPRRQDGEGFEGCWRMRCPVYVQKWIQHQRGFVEDIAFDSPVQGAWHLLRVLRVPLLYGMSAATRNSTLGESGLCLLRWSFCRGRSCPILEEPFPLPILGVLLEAFCCTPFAIIGNRKLIQDEFHR